jgi:Right handed beta helix region
VHISLVNTERGAVNARSKVALAALAALAFGLVDPTTSVDGAVVRSRDSIKEPTPRAAPFGDAACDGVVVQPGTDIQAAINAHPVGATFCLMPGVHRLLRGLRPKEDQRFIGEPGAVVSGSKVVPSWTLEGGFWVAAGQSQESPPAGVCQPASYKGCRYAEGVYLDDRNLRQVTDLAELSSGEFFFDYPSDRIYLADDPTGHMVEASVANEMFDAWGVHGVEVRGLVVEKFANPASSPALNSRDEWVVTGNEIRLNHGIGVAVGSRGTVRGNYVHDQGQLGMSGYGSVGGLVEDNEIAFNNTEGFEINWEAGGTKWVKTKGLTVRRNWVHDNHGHGLQTDIDNVGTTYVRNRVEDNAGVGILHEISYRAKIHHNYLARNGSLRNGGLDGSGILVASSSNVEVYANRLERNADGLGVKQDARGSGSRGRHVAKNVYAHHNVVVMCEGHTGAVRSAGVGSGIFGKRNNRFEKNRYRVASPGGTWWHWRNSPRSQREWKGYGHDRRGRFKGASC